jgi:riboflavin synthase
VFTGLVESVGSVARVVARGRGKRLTIVTDIGRDGTEIGASVSVDGVCVTVVGRDDDRFTADVVAETLARSTLGRLGAGDRVNLERALRATDRLGGHLVAGHVDGTVRVLAVRGQGADRRIGVELPAALAPYVARKGSIALNGVSLTVAARSADRFEVALVPHTLTHTTLGRIRAGHRLNVEVDLIARYLESLGQRRNAVDP